MDNLFTRTELIAAATALLETADYHAISNVSSSWTEIGAHAFEDEYGVVGIFAFDTADELLVKWPTAQGLLVDLISTHFRREEAKAWDGYLVLMTASEAPKSLLPQLEVVRYDTNRVRKIVITAEVLEVLGDLQSRLLSLFPLKGGIVGAEIHSPLDALPALLESEGVNASLAARAVEAFRRNFPVMDAIHRHLEEGANAVG